MNNRLLNKTKKVWFQSYGCQMNDHDTKLMQNILHRAGYQTTESKEEADVILVNTCSVRENPQNKLNSFLGRLRKLKNQKPSLLIGVCGCVAQQEKGQLFRTAPYIDLVFGPDQISEVAQLITQAKQQKWLATTQQKRNRNQPDDFIPEYLYTSDLQPEQIYHTGTASIAITKGCDNFCSFCIVPFTRGRETSRSPEQIIKEAEFKVAQGAKEILLLGQNVNSYKAKDCGFYELLQKLTKVKGLKRIRFISPHPSDWNKQLSELMAAESNICPYLHLPLQSGSDEILKAMRRSYNRQNYYEKVADFRQLVPNASLSTDLIVGFPGETQADFDQTLLALQDIRYTFVYAFKYSPRPGTLAATKVDDVPQEQKEARLSQVLQLQQKITGEIFESYLGQTQEVLIESQPKQGYFAGRNPQNIKVWVQATSLNLGSFAQVTIRSHGKSSLNGELLAANP